jgi:2-amino-4-hydroxy-6-hydroxymethyldihydropteridine diphosphokinase
MTRVFLALGSNVGERDRYLERAKVELQQRGVRIDHESEVRETEPFGVTDQPRFLNQVLQARWEGSPRELLAVAKEVERMVGRQPTFRWGPREIDVDILLFGTQTVSEPDLEIPHPGLRDRPFFREPLLELDPALAAWLDKEAQSRGVNH